MVVLADKVLVDFDDSGIGRYDSLSVVVAFRVEEALLNEISDGTGGVALAVVELRRDLGDRVTAFDGSEDFKFDAPERDVT